EKVEEEYLGRVFSVFGLIHMIAMPIGMLVFGPLSNTVDASLLILFSGIGMVAISMLVFLKRDFIKLGIK
ncbi:MAG TPA: MFS transporter, partial [Acholeplasmataceae bacterium]|nr:MFS transporter [Acholeplasmataceae bacterium]